ncbi:MAG: hypothetical protein AVDCRST_MAG70-1080, partial [uncultured Thermomicrobiales bacterium]
CVRGAGIVGPGSTGQNWLWSSGASKGVRIWAVYRRSCAESSRVGCSPRPSPGSVSARVAGRCV